MYTLLQSKRIRGSAGVPLPTVFRSLAERGAHFKRGQLGLLAAGPNTGKSALALTLALKAQVPTLYISADSDAFTQRTRAMSIIYGITQEEAVRRELEEDFAGMEGELDSYPIRFNYDASPSLDTIETELEAYYEVYAEFPHLIVADNVTNIRTGGDNDDDPFSGLEGLMDYLHTMARGTHAHVLGLHHVLADHNNGDKPIPLNGVKGQITRVPEIVLTAFRRDEGPWSTLCVSVVKNRGGRADPTGSTYAELEFDGEQMLIRDRQ